MDENFNTELHEKELDIIFQEPSSNLNDKSEDALSLKDFDGLYQLKTNFRYTRKMLSRFLKRFRKNENNTILFLTKGELPLDFIAEFRKQYPEKCIKVLIPIDSFEGLEKLNYDVEYFLQNKMNTASLFKLKQNRENVQIYGIYSESFSGHDREQFQYLASFVRAAREVIKKLYPCIVHSFDVPFFLGAEFDKQFPFGIKVIQTVSDFSKYDENKQEVFWAAINLADKTGMKKLCRDKIIQKCMASLFNLHNTKGFSRMRECLEFLYKNYFKFRSVINKNEEIEENILFNRMNLRALKLFPQLAYGDENSYNEIFYTIKRVNFWTVFSKTYYNDIFNKTENTSPIYSRLKELKDKSDWLSYGILQKATPIYQKFDVNNFRDKRILNKKYLIKEFSKDRIRTKFVDSKFFLVNDYEIKGFLEPSYESPLIFCNFSSDINGEGVDIALTSLLKLLELYKNILIIINIPNGLNINSINSWVEFMENKSAFDGRWVYINSPINLEQFYASADLTLFPARKNIMYSNQYKALQYGCIPVTTGIGCYNDVITDIFDDMREGCGFKTNSELINEQEILENFMQILNKAINLYSNNHSSWNLLIKNAMSYDSSWNFEKLEKYNQIYDLF